jgi:anti-sigma regulatory factor (Ser/Thr protein kinase)
MSATSRLAIELHATPEEVMRAVEELRKFARDLGIAEKPLFGLTLALEESGSNIVNHALKRDPTKKFLVILERKGRALTIELRDRGPEFDPTLTVPDNGSSKAEDDKPPGGWGIQLVRSYIDEIRYSREVEENVLRLTKHLDATGN